MIVKSDDKLPDKLVVYSNGTMQFNKRRLPSDDVIIYSDGFGSEKAAVKMYPGIHPPFYRDSVVIERKDKAEIASDNVSLTGATDQVADRYDSLVYEVFKKEE